MWRPRRLRSPRCGSARRAPSEASVLVRDRRVKVASCVDVVSGGGGSASASTSSERYGPYGRHGQVVVVSRCGTRGTRRIMSPLLYPAVAWSSMCAQVRASAPLMTRGQRCGAAGWFWMARVRRLVADFRLCGRGGPVWTRPGTRQAQARPVAGPWLEARSSKHPFRTPPDPLIYPPPRPAEKGGAPA